MDTMPGIADGHSSHVHGHHQHSGSHSGHDMKMPGHGHLHAGKGHKLHEHHVFFGSSTNFIFLLEPWDCSTTEGFLAAIAVTLVISLANEALAFSLYLAENLYGRSGSSKCGADLYRRIARSLLHAVRITAAFLLMLAAMTFNGLLFALIVGGSGLGYFLFRPVLLMLFKVCLRKRQLRSRQSDAISCDGDGVTEKWLKSSEDGEQESDCGVKLLSVNGDNPDSDTVGI